MSALLRLLVVILLLSLLAGLPGMAQTTPSPGTTTTTAEPLPLPVLVQKCSPSVVLIDVQLETGIGQGSGVILDPSGKILTCYHVVKGAKSALVKMGNGGFFPAEGLLGVNPTADLALLRLRAQGLPAVPIGDYTQLVQGEKVFVISSPIGLENTVSEGIFSGLRRVADLPEEIHAIVSALGHTDDQKLIQFTAPISHGSSGGPVFNGKGEVVGIVSLTMPQGDNVYFAIPAKLAEAHLPSETVMAFDAGGSGLPMGSLGPINPITGELPASLGRGKKTATSSQENIPSGPSPFIKLKEGFFVLPDSVRVTTGGTEGNFTRVMQSPKTREYRATPGGLVFFSEEDRGRRVRIDYDYSPERVAILPVVNVGGFPELNEYLRTQLQQKLQGRGYEIVPFIEVDTAVRAAGINLNRKLFIHEDNTNSGITPADIRSIAAQANAGLLAVCYVAAESWNAWTTGTAMTIGLLLYDGRKGRDVYLQILKDEKEQKWIWSGTKKDAREQLINTLLDRMLDEYMGVSSSGKKGK